MVITTPTRITIEVTPLEPGEAGQHGQRAAAPTQVANIVVGGSERSEAQAPARYESSPCHCLDDEYCTADHEHE